MRIRIYSIENIYLSSTVFNFSSNGDHMVEVCNKITHGNLFSVDCELSGVTGLVLLYSLLQRNVRTSPYAMRTTHSITK